MSSMSRTIEVALKNITGKDMKDLIYDNTSTNNKYLIDIIKEQFGITDDEMRTLTTEELKQKIRNNKLDNLL